MCFAACVAVCQIISYSPMYGTCSELLDISTLNPLVCCSCVAVVLQECVAVCVSVCVSVCVAVSCGVFCSMCCSVSNAQ